MRKLFPMTAFVSVLAFVLPIGTADAHVGWMGGGGFYGGGGGFHGGMGGFRAGGFGSGFHGGMGAFHSGGVGWGALHGGAARSGFHAGMGSFNAAPAGTGFHGGAGHDGHGGFHDGHWHDHFHDHSDVDFIFGWPYVAWPSYYPYYDYYPSYYPYADYRDYPYDVSYANTNAATNWYYCDEPQGYYPYVRFCNGGWQTVLTTPQS